ncbi:hypothetical protein Emed_006852 [Eimeria media]
MAGLVMYPGRDEGDLLQSEALEKELEYVEKELTGDFVGEGLSPNSTFKENTKNGRDSHSRKKWVGLLAGAGMLLAAGGLQISQKLQALTIAEKNMDVPKLYSLQIEAQQDELIHNVATLEEMWLISPDKVKAAFVRKLFSYTELSSDAAALATVGQNFEVALSSLLIPAAALQEAPLPVSKKDETLLRRQLTLVNCSVKAAQEQLSFLSELQEIQQVRREEGLPSLEHLKAQETNLVSQHGLMQMLTEGTDTETVEENAVGRVTAGIPRILAEAIADAMAEIALKAAAAERVNEAFAPFLMESEETDLSVLAGGRFRTTAFIGLLKGMQDRNRVLAFSSWQTMLQLTRSLSVENALGALSEVLILEHKEEESRRDLIRAALKTPADEAIGNYVVEDEELYRTVLGLFDLGG